MACFHHSTAHILVPYLARSKMTLPDAEPLQGNPVQNASQETGVGPGFIILPEDVPGSKRTGMEIVCPSPHEIATSLAPNSWEECVLPTTWNALHSTRPMSVSWLQVTSTMRVTSPVLLFTVPFCGRVRVKAGSS